ncbi:MAG: Oar protein, partial [Alteromonadales bacterium]|nr:Oar protein [Alteromonadales bacterium]
MNRSIKKRFSSSLTAIAVTLSLGVAVPAMAASNTAGSIYGKADASSKITYKNISTGVSRTINVSEDGRFKVAGVPAGRYIVTNEAGSTREIHVVIGTGSSVFFDDEREVIEVTGNRVSAIDTSSVESTRVFVAEDMDKLPLPRNSVAVALLTPGAIQGGASFDKNLPSFGGASIAENGYYIDGMDVTNLRTMLSFAKLPQDAISQTQIKSGGYGVEYGRSLGGITNIITKSGGNDFEVGGSVYYTPDALRSESKDTWDYDHDRIRKYNSADSYDSLKYNVFAGGAIVEDSLFFYANIEGQYREKDNYSNTDSYNYSVTNPNYMAKLDWYVNENHLLRFTHINNVTEYDRTNYLNPRDSEDETIRNTGEHGNLASSYAYKEGGEINVLAYTGYITDNLALNLMYGTLENKYLKTPNLEGDTCPYSWDTTNGVGWGGRTPIGCWNAPVQSSVVDQVDDKDVRTSMKIDVEWVLGDHTLRFGYNDELYEATSPGEKYSGDIYYRFRTAHENNNNTIDGVVLPEGT